MTILTNNWYFSKLRKNKILVMTKILLSCLVILFSVCALQAQETEVTLLNRIITDLIGEQDNPYCEKEGLVGKELDKCTKEKLLQFI